MILNINYIFKKNKLTLSIIFLSVIAYIVIPTGIHGDDFSVIERFQNKSFLEFLVPDINNFGLMIFNVVTYYIFWPAYSIFGFEYLIAYDIIKVISISLSVYLVYRFALDYLPNERAILASLLFVFYPLHDTTVYWYMTLPYVLMPSILMFAHHLIRNKRITFGTLLLILGSFMYYGSPPYIFGLAMIFLFEKKIKETLIFIVAGGGYVLYYFWVKLYIAGIENRISDQGAVDLIKSLIIQTISFFEASIGPSYWLKIFYSISSIDVLSLVISGFIIVTAICLLKEIPLSKKMPPSQSLFFGLTTILLLSLGMFALTGMYNHSPFNLGNRSTVYGSLLVGFLLATFLPINKKSIVLLSIIFILPVFGLSDHWKSWDTHQKELFHNIKHNRDLARLPEDSTLLVIGSTYSKLGPFSHIELLSMPWTVGTVFRNTVKSKNIIALTSYIVYKDNKLVDLKYDREYPIESRVYVYNSDKYSVYKVDTEKIEGILLQIPKELRHWLQVLQGTWVQDVILWLSPRLKYLFL